MSKDLHSLLRYLSIDSLLSTKAKVTSDEIIEACADLYEEGIDRKHQLKTDIEWMISSSDDGYSAPIIFHENENKWSYSDSGFSIQKLSLNKSQKEVLKQCIRYLDFLGNHKKFSGLKGIIQKLVDTIQIKEAGDNLESPDFVSSETPADFGGGKFLAPLIKSIKEKKVIRLYYLPFYEDKPYFILVHPYLLKEFKGRWYLIGLNDTKQEIRTYGLDRIWEINPTENHYIQKNFSASEYFKNTVGVISPIGDPPEIHIEVSSHQAKYLITQPLHESQYIEKEEKDFVIFSYRLHPTYEFKSLILAMGQDVKVLKPEKFKKEIIHELNNTILAYGRK